MIRRGQPEAAVRHRLIESTIAIIAADGVRAVTATAVTEHATLRVHTVSRFFGSRDQLLQSAALSVVGDAVLPFPDPRDSGDTPLVTLDRLARAHRRHTARSPERFAALLQLSSAALFTAPSLRPVLASRHRRVRATAEAHLRQLQVAGSIRAELELPVVAAGLMDAMTGIEICHLIDADAQIRDAAYRELCLGLTTRLTRAVGDD